MSIFDKVKQGASDAARKAQQTFELARLNSQKSSREKDMAKLYAELGEAMFEAYLTGETAVSEEKVASCCEQLLELKREIEAIEEKMKSVKLEKSCSCGKVVPSTVKFCPDCGTRFTEQEPKPRAEMSYGEIRVICQSCSTENELTALYCIDCGYELGQTKPSSGVHSNAHADASVNAEDLNKKEPSFDKLEADAYVHGGEHAYYGSHAGQQSQASEQAAVAEEPAAGREHGDNRERRDRNDEHEKPTRFAYEE